MTILSGQSIRAIQPLSPIVERTQNGGTTYGLGPAGYDLRLELAGNALEHWLAPGEFLLAAAHERFDMPDNLLGIVHDKSSWARRGLSVFNTVIEPGWRGFLTLELVNKGASTLCLRNWQGIAQVVFHRLDEPTEQPYEGKYQDQEAGPQGARS